MPTGSTEPDPPDGGGATSDDEPTAGRRLRTVTRWLPVAIAALVTAASGVGVAQLDDPHTTDGAAVAREPLSTPVLSLRRDLEPLRVAAAEQAMRTALADFVATQPPDTCLQVAVGDLSFGHRVDDPQTPASLQKLLTAVATLEALDPQARFVTKVLAGAPPVDGVVGDLYLRGAGDPLLATAEYMARERNQPQVFTDLDALADLVVAAGVRVVQGAIVGDESRYDAVRYNPAWPQRFLTQGQAGPLSALTVNDGFAFFPEAGGVFGAADDPAAYAAEVFARALRERGVEVAGARSGLSPDAAPVVAELASPPIADVVAQMLRESDNNTAELLVKELGRVVAGDGSTAAGTQVVQATLAGLGFDLTAVAVLDGSGLAPANRVTCALVSALLAHAPTADHVEAGLAVAGETGTLARRFTRPEVAGRVRAKTGTLNQVTALAGVAATGAGEARFALVANVADSDRIAVEVIAAQERLIDLLVGYPRLPDVEGLRP